METQTYFQHKWCSNFARNTNTQNLHKFKFQRKCAFCHFSTINTLFKYSHRLLLWLQTTLHYTTNSLANYLSIQCAAE